MGPLSWNAAKIVLAAGIPIQCLVSGNSDTHLLCNHQALHIMQKDGYDAYAQIVSNYLEPINRGAIWADRGWKNFAHYLGPAFGPWPDARTECRAFFDKAVSYWQRKNKKKAFFFLGAAAHLVQDVCVPHHAKGVAFCGHKEYEKWVQENCLDFVVYSGGTYHIASNPTGWVEANAKIAGYYFPYVSHVKSETSYRMTTEVLLPVAQRSTAGFFYFFLNRVNN